MSRPDHLRFGPSHCVRGYGFENWAVPTASGMGVSPSVVSQEKRAPEVHSPSTGVVEKKLNGKKRNGSRGKENIMAYLQSRKNKDGQVVSYSIRVYKGRDPRTGKQLTPYTMTWHVPEGWS